MLRHIVMIQFKDRMTKDEEAAKLKMMLENLKSEIPSLYTMDVGLNISTKPTAFDLVLTADFENETGLNAYRIHPAHQEVLDYLKKVMEKTAVVDYTL
ncbi:MAG: Dabb family protein [Bacteroidales bacterium]|nr:Dabb family protein [Bacteroidales bacterium]